MVKDPRQLIFIDETHKDQKVSRRIRAWGKRGSDGIALRRWFKDSMRYTLIAGMNIDGFVQSTLHIYPRNVLSQEGAAGTVTAEDFEEWVVEYLLPVLGNYSRCEENSILVMDNASTHCNERILEMIRSKGTYILFTAPYSADLNPIELGFNVYKSSLKNNSDLFERDWYNAHLLAIDAVTTDTCIKEFRKCGVPKSFHILTSDEKKKILVLMNIIE